ncbi:MAG: manganese efflux pump MntP family protein [Clostridia bacterium]
MGLIEIFLTAVSLAMDAFAVSITNGVVVADFKKRYAVKMGLYFGVFQFVMPLIGYALGSSFRSYIETFDHWIAFGLLVLIGGNMIRESIWGEEEESVGKTAKEALNAKVLTVQAIATSIDALAVGISFSLLPDVDMWLSCTIIGIVAFLFSFFGGLTGKKIGGLFKDKAELAGGIVLCAIGIKILVEHLFF